MPTTEDAQRALRLQLELLKLTELQPRCQRRGGPIVRRKLAAGNFPERASSGCYETVSPLWISAKLSPVQGLLGSCVRKTRNRHAVRKMKEGPSEPPCRRRLQTALSCFGPKGRGGER